MSKLTGISPQNIIKYVNELNSRQIIQKRGSMRAVLPSAIANKLSDELLKGMSIDILIGIIKENERLELSFFKRLRFLHNKEYSMQIARNYLNNMSFERISKHEMDLLQCIKVIIPDEVLIKLGQIKNPVFFTRENTFFYEWARILNYIAYEPESFFSACLLLIRFAISESEKENSCSARDLLYSLFHIVGSGTHASFEERVRIIGFLIILNDLISIKVVFSLVILTNLFLYLK